jgi:isopentenyl diphosphate isomerase/L-lactate dehydrogenase-like FMN-dependent dehydrogenase
MAELPYVFLGKAMLYGVAALGTEGAQKVLAIFQDEMDRALALFVALSIGEHNPGFLRQEEWR